MKSQIKVLYYTICIISLLFTACGKDSTSPTHALYAVHGRVVDGTGNGVEGVTIYLEGIKFWKETVTDTNGLFRISGVPNGIFFISARKKGYHFTLPQTEITVLDSDLILTHILAEVVPDVSIFGISMVSISEGSYMMGSDEGDPEEKPVHEVHIEAFDMSATEITQKQFEKIMNMNNSHFSGDENLPVERVSWIDAARFCNRLSDITGIKRCYDEVTWECDMTVEGYRLPTEAEWEYACRAGTATRYYTGDTSDDLSGACWYSKNSGSKTNIVGQKIPNVWGLYDMHGNVFEWCNDWYSSDYYSSSPVDNPPGPTTGTNKVYRGGSWLDVSEFCTSSNRGSSEPDFMNDTIGLRIVLRKIW